MALVPLALVNLRVGTFNTPEPVALVNVIPVIEALFSTEVPETFNEDRVAFVPEALVNKVSVPKLVCPETCNEDNVALVPEARLKRVNPET